MKKIYFFTFILLANFSLGQEKAYRFLYDFHQDTKLDKAENPNISSDDYVVIVAELNKSYEVEVMANTSFSFVKLVEKINNEQNKSFIKIEPEPKWLLNDFVSDASFKYSDFGTTYFKDSIQTLSVLPTRNSKKVLGLDAKEFIAEDASFNYRFWLVKYKNLTVSPLNFQFKDYILVEAEVVNKKPRDSKTSSERKVTYLLKNMDEQSSFDFNTLIPKKVMTKLELDNMLKKANDHLNNEVDKD